ncbi:hypothetical protein ASPCADRAFT_204874 [Aspergillus carbonarius ITEM 5010]|uniref:Uncharacterized protein n=1 Tax=Aspergillus carbonarius (strain ITEM 5010) TaxID=602072 RepID=A0A1R3RXJ6_ASPC5|nr:hypothetical protein ASPCADRAFT_204874 [Aspergillus carbonarius ITEM 5010]
MFSRAFRFATRSRLFAFTGTYTDLTLLQLLKFGLSCLWRLSGEMKLGNLTLIHTNQFDAIYGTVSRILHDGYAD